MLSDNSITLISHIFCGDEGPYYSYKKGSELVRFFNQYFGSKDTYQSGFPSRWIYVFNKIVDLINSNRIDSFFNLILGKEFLIRDRGITEIEAVELSQEIYNEFNSIIKQDLCIITHNRNEYHLTRINDDLIFIGSGGFANVYKQKSTGLVVKKLKEDFLTDTGIKSRFKREYNITKALQDLAGIIRIFDYDESNCSYTMELAEITLEQFILNNQLPEESKLNCIRQILHIMMEVHKKDIIHRDLSANNIFIISGRLKIADFGLGKDLTVFTSHQTMHTNFMGQYFYCAPEQFMMLKDADKRSDVYSLGRIINFIMTGDVQNSNHIYKNVSDKATNSDAAYRYADASQLSLFFEKSVQYHSQAKNKELVENKILHNTYDEDVENYIYEMTSEQLSKKLLDDNLHFPKALLLFMHSNEEQARHIIQSIEKSFREICGRSYEAYDPFASFAAEVLNTDFSFVVKEVAAMILRYVAWDVNRFFAQHLVEEILSSDIDPMIKDIIRT